MTDIIEALRKNIPFWEPLSEKEISIHPIYGGLTNKLYCAEISERLVDAKTPFKENCVAKESLGSQENCADILEGHAPIRKVFIRIFGDKDLSREEFRREIAKESEMVHRLSGLGLAPKIYFEFPEGRLEEFIEGTIPSMETMQNKDFLKEVVSIVAKFHQTKLSEKSSLKDVQIRKGRFEKYVSYYIKSIKKKALQRSPIQKPSQPVTEKGKEIPRKRDFDSNNSKPGVKSSKNSLKTEIKDKRPGFFVDSPRKSLKGNEKQAEAPEDGTETILRQVESDMERQRCRQKVVECCQRGTLRLEGFLEIEAIEREAHWLIGMVHGMGPLDFCHNDVQRGNIIVSGVWGEAGCKIFLIDFEYAGWNPPGLELGNLFCETHIDNFHDDGKSFFIQKSKFPSPQLMEEVIRAYLSSFGKVSENAVKAQLEETKVGVLCSHFYWALWGILQTATSDIEWCYRSYSIARLEEYFRLKKKFGF